MTGDLPIRLHALLAELLRELLARGADREWLEPRVQAAVDLVHEVDGLRPPDPRHLEQFERARRFETAVLAAVRAGCPRGEAESVVAERQGLTKYARKRLRDLPQPGRFTLTLTTEDPHDATPRRNPPPPSGR